MVNIKDPISLPQAAEIAGEEPANFRHFIIRGETPPHIRIGRFYVFSRKEMMAWKKPRKKQGGSRKKK